MKIVSNYKTSDLNWLDTEIDFIYFKEFLEDPVKADLVYFSGGSDITPELYGEYPRYSYSNIERDYEEMRVYMEARALSIPCLGICRGAQLLTALQPEGKLIQDVSGHSSDHLMKLLDSEEHIYTTSCHHQMMFPFGIKEYEMLAISNPNISRYYLVGQSGKVEKYITNIIKSEGEPEVVFYPRSRSLGIQGHPEFIDNIYHEYPSYCRKIVQEKLL